MAIWFFIYPQNGMQCIHAEDDIQELQMAFIMPNGRHMYVYNIVNIVYVQHISTWRVGIRDNSFCLLNTFLHFPNFLPPGFMIFRTRKYVNLSTGIEHLPKSAHWSSPFCGAQCVQKPQVTLCSHSLWTPWLLRSCFPHHRTSRRFACPLNGLG